MRQLHPQLRLILGLHVPAIALGLGNGIGLPVLPELTKLYGVSIVQASWVFVVFLLGTLAASLPTGMLIDRIGRRWILLAGPVVVALSSLLIAKAAVSGSFSELLVYRFIAGVGTQMWMQSALRSSPIPERRSSAASRSHRCSAYSRSAHSAVRSSEGSRR